MTTIQKIRAYFFCIIVFSFLSALCCAEDNILPDGWFFVDCLSSFDGAFINTRISQKNAIDNVRIECVCDFTQLNVPSRRLMGFDGRSDNYFGINSENKFDIGSLSKTEAKIGRKYRLVFEQRYFGTTSLFIYNCSDDNSSDVLLDKTKALQGQFNDSVCHIFSIPGHPFPGVRVYSFKIFIDQKLFGEFKPVWNFKDNLGGMFDTVSRQLFLNAGKGHFSRDEIIPPEHKIISFQNPFSIPTKVSQDRIKSKVPLVDSSDWKSTTGVYSFRVIIASLVIAFLFCGIYFTFSRYFLHYEYIAPIGILCLFVCWLWIGGLFNLLPVFSLLIVGVSLFGWLKKIIKNWSIWNDLQFKNSIWLFFLLGMILLAINCGFMTIEGNNVVCKIVPYIQGLCSSGTSQNYFLNHQLSAIASFTWFCNRCAFVCFDQSILLWIQLLFAFSSFLTVFGLFRYKVVYFILWTIVLIFSLFLFESPNCFFRVAGAALLIASFFAICLRNSKDPTFSYKILSISVSVLIFIFLLCIPNIDIGNNFRYVFPAGIFSLCFSTFWFTFWQRPTEKTFPVLIPILVTSFLLAPREVLFLPIISLIVIFVFLLLKRISLKKSDFSANNKNTYFFAVAVLVFFGITTAILYSYKNSDTDELSQSDKNEASFLALTYKNASYSRTIAWHNEELPDAARFKNIYKCIDDISKIWQKEPFYLKRITLNHILSLYALYIPIVILISLIECVRRKKNRIFLITSGTLLVLFCSAFVYFFSLYINNLLFPLQIDKHGFLDEPYILFLPFISLLFYCLILFVVKTNNIIKNKSFAVSILIALTALPIIFLYCWIPNRGELFHGAKHSKYNMIAKNMVNNMDGLTDKDKLLVLSDNNVNELYFSYLLMNLKHRIPLLVNFANINESIDDLSSKFFDCDKIMWINSNEMSGALNVSNPLVQFLSITNTSQLGNCRILEKQFVNNHLLFIPKTNQLEQHE